MSPDAIQAAVREALNRNRRYDRSTVLGFPGSFLDRRVFPPLPELEGFALLSSFRDNPNHIGCHTLGGSESAFEGTQAIERDLLRLCAEEILHAESGSWDGYVASGGTESNIQALWTFRNYFRDVHGAAPGEVGVLYTEDAHYSMPKAADVLGLTPYVVPVDPSSRAATARDVSAVAAQAEREGVRFLAVVLNMGTTMFGSVDDPETFLPPIEALGIPYLAHVDAAFGGFIYPLLAEHNALDFRDQRLTSFTLDAHKMLQAPYGTGIHLIRKGMIEHVYTKDAQYVPGLDCTLVGSRSGTNAVAVWMILQTYGHEGGVAFCRELTTRAETICAGLQELGVAYYRHPAMNVIAMRAEQIPEELVSRWLLVPDTHEGPATWVKVVVMEHVTDELVDAFLDDLRRHLT